MFVVASVSRGRALQSMLVWLIHMGAMLGWLMVDLIFFFCGSRIGATPVHLGTNASNLAFSEDEKNIIE